MREMTRDDKYEKERVDAKAEKRVFLGIKALCAAMGVVGTLSVADCAYKNRDFLEGAYKETVGDMALKHENPRFETIRGNKYGLTIFKYCLESGESAWRVKDQFNKADVRDIYADVELSDIVWVDGTPVGNIVQPKDCVYVRTYLKDVYW